MGYRRSKVVQVVEKRGTFFLQLELDNLFKGKEVILNFSEKSSPLLRA